MVSTDDGRDQRAYGRITMRLPIRSETEAVRFVFAGAAIVGISVVLGIVTAALVGIAAFVLALVVAAVAYLRADNPEARTPLRAAEHEPHPHGALPGTRTRGRQRDTRRRRAQRPDHTRGQPAVEVDVLAPVLTSHTHYAMSDIDGELADARTRLQRSLTWAREHGIAARGEVGDPIPRLLSKISCATSARMK